MARSKPTTTWQRPRFEDWSLLQDVNLVQLQDVDENNLAVVWTSEILKINTTWD